MISVRIMQTGRDSMTHPSARGDQLGRGPQPLARRRRRIAPMQSPSHGHRETARRFERLVTTSAIVGVLLLVAYHAVRYIAGVL